MKTVRDIVLIDRIHEFQTFEVRPRRVGYLSALTVSSSRGFDSRTLLSGLFWHCSGQDRSCSAFNYVNRQVRTHVATGGRRRKASLVFFFISSSSLDNTHIRSFSPKVILRNALRCCPPCTCCLCIRLPGYFSIRY